MVLDSQAMAAATLGLALTGGGCATGGPGIQGTIQQMTDPLVKMNVRVVGDGLVRDGEWSVLHVSLQNNGDAVTGTLNLRTTDSGGVAVAYQREVELPAGSTKDVRIPWKPGLGGRTRVIRFDAATRSVEVPFNVRFAEPDEPAIGWLGEESAGLQTLRDTWTGQFPSRAFVHDKAESPIFDEDTDEAPIGRRLVHTGQIPEAIAPDRSNGYDVFDWLVWVDADPTRLTPEQAAAVQGWVAGGGHLFLTVTTRWRQLDEGPLRDLLPVELEGLRDGLAADRLLVDLGGSRTGVVAPEAIATLREVPGRYTKSIDDPADGVTWAVGTYGLGTVHVLTVDPRAAPLSTGLDRVEVWRTLLHLPAPGADRAMQPYLDEVAAGALDLTPRTDSGMATYDPTMSRLDTDWPFRDRVRTWLSDIPGVAPLPISWLLLFSGIYLLVIGPIDYLVLRALNRQPWTWVTFPVSIAVFSAVALVGVSYVKGSQAVVTRMEVVDLLPGTSLMRGASDYGVWSTRSADLSLRSGSADGIADLVPIGSYQVDPRVVHGAGGSSLHWQADTWTLAFVRTTWMAPASGRIDVQYTEKGYTITNKTPWTLDPAVLHIAKVQYPLGALAPEATITVDIRSMSPTLPRDPGDWDADAPEQWAIQIATNSMDPRRGDVNFETWSGVVIGEVRGQPIEASVLDGLTPLPLTKSVVRAPYFLPFVPARSMTPAPEEP